MSEEVKVMQVIRTILDKRGKGTEEDPIRRITQYWDMEGNILFEIDPCAGEKGKWK